MNDKRAIGKLSGFPTRIIDSMISHQVKQGNVKNVAIFQNEADADKSRGGFDWDLTAEGFSNWHAVIDHKRFDTLFRGSEYTDTTATATGTTDTKEGTVIGYNFKDEKFVEPFERISGRVGSILDNGCMFTTNSQYARDMEELGLLDIWFDKVYQKIAPFETITIPCWNEEGEPDSFEVIVSSKGIYFAEGNVMVSVADLSKLCRDTPVISEPVRFYDVSGTTDERFTYDTSYFVDIGCKKHIALPMVQYVVNACNRLLMKS